MFKVGDKVRVKAPSFVITLYDQHAAEHFGAIGVISDFILFENTYAPIYVDIDGEKVTFEPHHLELIEEDMLYDHSILVEMIREGKISGSDLVGLKVIPTHFGVADWYDDSWTKIAVKGSITPHTIKIFKRIYCGCLNIELKEDTTGYDLSLDTFRIIPQDDGFIKIGDYLFTYTDAKLGCFGRASTNPPTTAEYKAEISLGKNPNSVLESLTMEWKPADTLESWRIAAEEEILHKIQDCQATLEGYKHDIYSLTSKKDDLKRKTSTDRESGGRAASLRSPRRCKAATGRRPIGNRACHPGSYPAARAGEVSGSRAKARH